MIESGQTFPHFVMVNSQDDSNPGSEQLCLDRKSWFLLGLLIIIDSASGEIR